MYGDDDGKIFQNGRNQTVRLPRECRFSGEEVAVNKIGDIVMLLPKENKWSGFLNSLNLFSEDFMDDGRRDNIPQERQLKSLQTSVFAGF